MKPLRSSLLGVSILSLAVGLVSPAVAVADYLVPDPSKAELSWTTPIDSDMTNKSTTYASVLFTGGVTPDSVPWVAASEGEKGFSSFCSEVDATCLPTSRFRATGLGLFTLCSDSPVAPCVETLEYQDASSTWKTAEFLKEEDLSATPARIAAFAKTDLGNNTLVAVQSKWGWKANETKGIPGSARGPLIFKLPGKISSAGTDTYSLIAKFNFNASAMGSEISGSASDFNIALRPTLEITCNNSDIQPVRGITLDKNTGARGLGGGGGACIDAARAAYVSSTAAGWAARYQDNLPIRLTIHLPSSLGGWFQGRVDNPDIQVSKMDAKSNRVVLTGSPIEAPITSKQLDVDAPNAEATINAYWPGGYAHIKDMKSKGMYGVTGPIWAPEIGTNWYEIWGSLLDEKARGSASIWQYAHFKAEAKCLGNPNELQGLVTTNAMMYQAKTPLFENGALTYKVAGVHLNDKGDVFRGSYNFIMRSSTARCLYGFSSAPVSGTVSVTSSNGEQQVAVTSVTEKDGWLKLSAQGFTFSSPTISAKLTQAGTKPVVKPVIKTITCVKGKTTKKVSGTAPKCPSGYKVKK